MRDALGVAEMPLKVEFLKRNPKKEQRPELIESGWTDTRQVKMDSDGGKTSGRRGEREIGGDLGRRED